MNVTLLRYFRDEKYLLITEIRTIFSFLQFFNFDIRSLFESVALQAIPFALHNFERNGRLNELNLEPYFSSAIIANSSVLIQTSMPHPASTFLNE